VSLKLGAGSGPLAAMQFNPRTGERKELGEINGQKRFEFRPPDEEDWVVILSAAP
jgi:hypothetical protein